MCELVDNGGGCLTYEKGKSEKAFRSSRKYHFASLSPEAGYSGHCRLKFALRLFRNGMLYYSCPFMYSRLLLRDGQKTLLAR